MLITLVDIDEAVERLVAGEQPYEYKTEDPSFASLDPPADLALRSCEFIGKMDSTPKALTKRRAWLVRRV